MSLHITIHRGIDQIGGCIMEIATDNAKILIDLGGNLPSADNAEDELADADAIKKLTTGVNAIIYTHYHGDHVSLFPYVPTTIPQYIGKGALEIMKLPLQATLKHEARNEEMLDYINQHFHGYTAQETLTFGDIRVTPYYTSHSAYDAYMLLIEAGGKRILHTGDFRGHGYLSGPLLNDDPQKNMLLKYIAPVDILITEGTMLSRHGEGVPTEADIKHKIQEYIAQHKYVFVLTSSTDCDRLSSIYRACKRTRRMLICDWYQKSVLAKFHELAGSKGGYYKFDDMPIYDFIGQPYPLSDKQLFVINKFGFCALVRSSQYDVVRKWIEQFGKENCCLIYSMWRGYYDGSVPNAVNDKIVQLRSLFDAEKITYIHTSGHADCQTLEKVITLLNPREAIIGIHKDAKTSLTSLNLSDELKAKIVPENKQMECITIK